MSFDVNIVQAYEMKKNNADGIWCGVYEIYAISSVLYEYNVKIIRYNINCSDFSNSNLHVVEHFQSVTLPGIYSSSCINFSCSLSSISSFILF